MTMCVVRKQPEALRELK